MRCLADLDGPFRCGPQAAAGFDYLGLDFGTRFNHGTKLLDVRVRASHPVAGRLWREKRLRSAVHICATLQTLNSAVQEKTEPELLRLGSSSAQV
jgi:hypothetical protein